MLIFPLSEQENNLHLWIPTLVIACIKWVKHRSSALHGGRKIAKPHFCKGKRLYFVPSERQTRQQAQQVILLSCTVWSAHRAWQYTKKKVYFKKSPNFTSERVQVKLFLNLPSWSLPNVTWHSSFLKAVRLEQRSGHVNLPIYMLTS